MSEQLGAALGYARRGFSVFPLRPRGKAPLFPTAHPGGDPLAGQCKSECGRDGHGLYDATVDPDRIRAWWSRSPRANIGVRTGIRFDVLDLDGSEGAESMRRFCAEHHLSLANVPWVPTPGGGSHGFFEPAGLGCKTGLLPRVDWKGAGGYLVVGPSVHPNGGQYRPVPPEADRPGVLPAPLRALLEPPKPPPVAPRATFRPVATGGPYARGALERARREILATPAGDRNGTAYSAAAALFELVAGGVVDELDAVAALTDAMQQAGLDDGEIPSTIGSARRRGLQQPRGLPAGPLTPVTAANPQVAPTRHAAPVFPSGRSLKLYEELLVDAKDDSRGRLVQQYRSQERLARRFGVTTRTIERDVEKLKQRGYLLTERDDPVPLERGRWEGKRLRYVLLLDPAAMENATVEKPRRPRRVTERPLITDPTPLQRKVQVGPTRHTQKMSGEDLGKASTQSNHGEGGGVPDRGGAGQGVDGAEIAEPAAATEPARRRPGKWKHPAGPRARKLQAAVRLLVLLLADGAQLQSELQAEAASAGIGWRTVQEAKVLLGVECGQWRPVGRGRGAGPSWWWLPGQAPSWHRRTEEWLAAREGPREEPDDRRTA